MQIKLAKNPYKKILPGALIKRYYQVTANAIKAILATAKRLEKKLARVEVRSISDLKNNIKKYKKEILSNLKEA